MKYFKIFFFILYASITPSAFAFKIVTSIAPIAALVRALVANEISVEVLVDNAVSPHTYSLRPSDLHKLSTADLIFWIGPQYESFLKKVLENYSHKNISLIISPHLHLYPIRERDEKSNKDVCTACPCGTALGDQHIWLDPDNGYFMAEEIVTHLIKLDPDHQDKYQERLQNLKIKLQKTKKEMKHILKPFQDKNFLVFHDGYQYFEKAVHLTGGQAMSLTPDIALSAKRLKYLRGVLTSKNIQCLFGEKQFPMRLIQNLVQGTDIKIGLLDPLGTSKTSYEDLLLSLAHSFSSCFKAPSS